MAKRMHKQKHACIVVHARGAQGTTSVQHAPSKSLVLFTYTHRSPYTLLGPAYSPAKSPAYSPAYSLLSPSLPMDALDVKITLGAAEDKHAGAVHDLHPGCTSPLPWLLAALPRCAMQLCVRMMRAWLR